MSSPLLWFGNTAKLLKSTLDINGSAQILSGAVDPSSSATSAPKGSIYLSTSTGLTYLKTDAGSSTNWVLQTGAVITPWTAYTPTFTGFGTVGTTHFWWRQVGGSIEVMGRVTVGTPTATEARFSLPNGYTSSASYSTIEQAGDLTTNSNGVGSFYTLIEPSKTYITVGLQNSGNNALTKVNGNIIVGAGDAISLQAIIVVDGISGTTPTYLSPVNLRYYSSSTSISGSLATITYATKDYDSSSAYSSGVFTVPSGGDGKYQINAALLIAGTIALNNTAILEIQKNSSVISRFTEYFPATLTDGKVTIGDIISLAAGDTIRIQASTSVTAPSIVSSNFDNYLSLARVST